MVAVTVEAVHSEGSEAACSGAVAVRDAVAEEQFDWDDPLGLLGEKAGVAFLQVGPVVSDSDSSCFVAVALFDASFEVVLVAPVVAWL